MKLNINTNIEQGKYYVIISVVELSHEEQSQITKFGSPSISILPKNAWYRNSYVDHVPLHAINYKFEFNNEAEAIKFSKEMEIRIKEAVIRLRNLRDNFTHEKILDF